MSQPKISDSTVRRLSVYLRLLRELNGEDRDIVSSQELAERSGTTSAQVRKDLSLFGSFGKRGRGYDVDGLVETLARILGLGRTWRVAVVGAGKIGSALLGYRDLGARGFDIVAAFDTDSDKVGREIFGVEVAHLSQVDRVVGDREVEIAIVATPPQAAQDVTDRLAAAGVAGILNFAPVKLDSPPGVRIRSMDVALELEGLSFALSRSEDRESTER